MNELIQHLINAIPSTALPIVVCVIGIAWLYFKFDKVQKDRIETKVIRDNDSQSVHDQLLKHDFKITELQGIVNLHRDKLDSIDKQLAIVNQELVKLNVQVESLVHVLEAQNKIFERSIKGK